MHTHARVSALQLPYMDILALPQTQLYNMTLPALKSFPATSPRPVDELIANTTYFPRNVHLLLKWSQGRDHSAEGPLL